MDLRRCNAVRAASALLLCHFVANAPAAGQKSPSQIVISDVWARPTPPALKVGAVYLSIANRGPKADRLIGAETALAESVEFHQTAASAGLMQMRQVPFVECAPGATVNASPGALHIMLLGLKQPLQAGKAFSLSLHFRDAGVLVVQVAVQGRD